MSAPKMQKAKGASAPVLGAAGQHTVARSDGEPVLWPMASLATVAPAQPSAIQFAPDEHVWHLTLDQIEANTGRVVNPRIAPACEAGASTYAFDDRTVLYSKLRPYLNKVVRPRTPGIATTELVPLRPRPEVLLPDFLTHYLRAPRFVAFASSCIAGTKMPRVIMAKFWQQEIPLPPLSEQHRIVEILDQAERLRRLRAEADAKAHDILPTLFAKMFGDSRANAPQFPIVELGSVIAEGPQNGLYKPASDYGDGTRILRIDGFYSGQVARFDNLKRLRLSPDESREVRAPRIRHHHQPRQ